MRSKVIIFVSIVLIIILASSTFAWWIWNSSDTQQTDVSLSVEGLTVTFEGGNNLTGKNLIPMSDKPTSESATTGIYKQFTASATSSVYMDLLLTLKTLPQGLQDESLVWELYEDDVKIGNGNFGSVSQGDVITLATNRIVNTTTKNYKLYIWIDGTVDNPSEMMNQSYEFVLSATATDEEP